jgi:hypothetical protein
MKYALCFRGISYFDKFTNNETIAPWDVDFLDSIPSFQNNVINPLVKNGHTVDIFFTTYESKYLELYKSIMKPVKVHLNKYEQMPAGRWSNVNKIIIDSFKLVKQQEEETNTKYDFIIISRFDIYIFENIMNVHIIPNGISAASKGEADFFIISGDIFDLVCKYFIELRNNNAVTHYYSEYCMQKGIRCHKFYKEITNQKNHPFQKTARQLFTPKGHLFHLCELIEIYNPSSEFYGFVYPPVKEFTSC